MPCLVHAGNEPIMRVLIDESKKVRFRSDGKIPLSVSGLSYVRKRANAIELKASNNKILWKIDKDTWRSIPSSSLIKVSTTDPRGIWLGKRRYAGNIKISHNKENLIVVNHLGIERYLVSVVGAEMPKSWPQAALKAQAVAARTYVLKRFGKKEIFDINSTESSQVYLGLESETKSTKRAVKSTRSLVIKYKGKLISAVFHSSSGGQTEASGSVWKYQLPYLKSVPDYDNHSPKYRWKKKFETEQLKIIFPQTGGVQNIQIINKSKTGRVLNAKVYGPKGYVYQTGRQLRERLGLKSTLVRFKMVSTQDSSNNLKEKVRQKDINNKYTENNGLSLPKARENYDLIVNGNGAGHGVGLSQWGANGLAKRGANFKQIIYHYYSGVKIRPY